MRHIVGIADMVVSNQSQDSIITFSLGACIGLVIHDDNAKAGGILHYMLPNSSIDRGKVVSHPYMFADSGIPEFFRQARDVGIDLKRMTIFAAGGAGILNQDDLYHIGRQNEAALNKILEKINLKIHHQMIGGNVNRTIRLEIDSGDIFVSSPGTQEVKI